MERLYRITPLEKKSIEYFVDVFERLPDGTFRGFDVTEHYRWGQGFRELDEEVWKYEVGDNGVHCRPDVGWGCELDDLCAVVVNFDDNFTDEERAEIEALCRGEKTDDEDRWGLGWIYDGDHAWEIEDDHVRIVGPVKIDLVTADGEVIEENIQPYDNDTPAT